MTKHQRGAHNAVSEITLADAEAAVEAAQAKKLEATAAVEQACQAFGGMTDRRVIADLQRLQGYERERLADPSLSPDQRKQLEARVAFHDAVAAERDTQNKLATAESLRDDIRAAAALAALGDGRAALADAIAAHAEAERLSRANAAAHERAELGVLETYSAEREAERALQDAKDAAPARIAAEYRGDTPEPGPTVAQAEAALAAVQQKRADIRAARDALEKEANLSRSRAGFKHDKVKAAAAFVLKSSLEAQALVDAFVEAERRHARLRQAVQALSLMGALHDVPTFNLVQSVDRSDEMAWTGALTALLTDPAAKLPQVS